MRGIITENKMKKSKLFFGMNLGVVIFLGIGWFYFYWFTLTDDITRMPGAMTANSIIAGLNLLFASSLILLPISYRKRK